MICSWQRDFYATSNDTLSFMVILLFSRFFFTHHVNPIIEEVEFDTDVVEAIAPDLKDRSHIEKEARKWSLISDFFYKKAIEWKPPHSLTPQYWGFI